MLVHETSDLIHQLEEIMGRSHAPISDSHGVLITKKKLQEVINLLYRWDHELTNFSLALAKVEHTDNPKLQEILYRISYYDVNNSNVTMDAILNNMILNIRESIDVRSDD